MGFSIWIQHMASICSRYYHLTPDEVFAYAEYKRFTPDERIYFAYTHPCRAVSPPYTSPNFGTTPVWAHVQESPWIPLLSLESDPLRFLDLTDYCM